VRLTIAADNAVFGEPEVRFSSVGPAIVMPAIIGYKKARELLYFGDRIDAATALSLGMVNRVVPLAELGAASVRWAKQLSLISPEALYAAKRAINRTADAAGSVRHFMPVLMLSARSMRPGPSLVPNSVIPSRLKVFLRPSAGAPRSSRNRRLKTVGS
jgi:enoyl-CoA hydratase/carnithine racemase